MAGVKDKIVTHRGRIVVMGGKIVMGPCDRSESNYYVRLMVGDETMEDWWWRISDAGPASDGTVKYYPEATFTPRPVPGYVDEGSNGYVSWRYWFSDYHDLESLGIGIEYRYLGHEHELPNVALFRNRVCLLEYRSEFREYETRFTTKSRNSDKPDGILEEGTYVLVCSLVAKGVQDYSVDYGSSIHESGSQVAFVGGGYSFFKFTISNAEDGKGLADSGINVEIDGFGDWHEEVRISLYNSGVIMDSSLVPRLEIVKRTKDKDGNPVEEVVWQSE